ncbi:hypothetical protein COU78_00190 [Candidatus Peregrinibacteria bacterium CG10_big_fil_rev_8_21_14_0_10_49_24]|nr:MAG: hypothetical protein COU78_00190 [Candidatus Peregrinibacteria bacterium CG10_big_fil_rev_8_21_14_0_10_49_24]
MSTDNREYAYIHAAKKESEKDAARSALLLESGIATQIASFIDANRTGIHVDINGMVGGLAALISARTNQKVIAMLRNYFNAQRAAESLGSANIPVETHMNNVQLRASGTQPLHVEYPISLPDLQSINLQNSDAVAVLCDDIRSRGVLDSLLNLKPVDSVTWTFPTYNFDIASAEYPNHPTQTHSAMHMALADREHVMRYATQYTNPGAQLVVAGDAPIHPQSGAQDILNNAHERMGHWQPYWEPRRAFTMRNTQNEPIQWMHQQHGHNGFIITELRRNEKKMEKDALEASNMVLRVR